MGMFDLDSNLSFNLDPSEHQFCVHMHGQADYRGNDILVINDV